MAKLLVLVIGIVLTAAAIAEMWWQWEAVKTVFWGLLGILVLCAGILALAIAISEITSSK